MRPTVALLLISSLLLACGHTLITTSDRQAHIYIDGENMGKGSAEVKRMGFPGSVDVEVRRDGEVMQRQTIQRNFTFTTLVVGLFTMYTGLIWAWQYPKNVELFVPELDRPTKRSSWDQFEGSPWDNAPN
jgi:hypothetical protein